MVFLPEKDMIKEKERGVRSSQVLVTLSRVERVREIIEHNSALLEPYISQAVAMVSGIMMLDSSFCISPSRSSLKVFYMIFC
jgi:hypothetical protein